MDIAETTDFFALRGMRSRGTLAEMLALRGKVDEAQFVAAEATGFHERKGDVTGIAVLNRRFADVGLEIA